jgi:hypothetical protein
MFTEYVGILMVGRKMGASRIAERPHDCGNMGSTVPWKVFLSSRRNRLAIC